MSKKEIKFSLLGDYINILHIFKVCECFNTDYKTTDKRIKIITVKRVACELKNVYENLFFKLGFIDLSFLILKKDILTINVKEDIDSVSLKTIDAFYSILKKIVKNISFKLRKLRFSEIEVDFLVKKVNI